MTLTLALTITTTLEAFDAAAQTTFKANLAAQLDGISPSDITLQVRAASVGVVATISAPSKAVGNAALGTLQSLAASTEALTTALGVPVEKVDAAPALVLEESQEVGDQSSTDGIGATAAGIGAAAGLVLLLVIHTLYRRRNAALRRERSSTLSAIDVKAVEVDVESVASVKVELSSHESPQRAHVTPPSLKRSSSGSQELLLWERPAASIGAPHVWSEHERELGRGSFGTVYRVECDGYAYAAKRFTVEPGAARQEIDQVLCREANALRKLKHPNIVRLWVLCAMTPHASVC